MNLKIHIGQEQKICELYGEFKSVKSISQAFKIHPDTTRKILKKYGVIFSVPQPALSKMTENEKAYIAGLLDGEGCISISKSKPSKGCVSPSYLDRVHITNTDKRMIDFLIKTTGIGFVTETQPKNRKHKKRYDWVLSKGAYIEFLNEISPFLIIKKEQSEMLLKYRETFMEFSYGRKTKDILEKREFCYQKLKEMHL